DESAEAEDSDIDTQEEAEEDEEEEETDFKSYRIKKSDGNENVEDTLKNLFTSEDDNNDKE
ncbi:MAG: hypothetical protein IJV72_02550, partial [Clostridia bacterium]|nr:hypothetical protein [Clostridia bacterium]